MLAMARTLHIQLWIQKEGSSDETNNRGPLQPSVYARIPHRRTVACSEIQQAYDTV
jgi:hypothetical protein